MTLDQKIEKIIKNAQNEGLTRFGLKIVDTEIKVGENVRNSIEITRKYTDDRINLDGTSCLNIDSFDGLFGDVDGIENDVKNILEIYKNFGTRVILVGGTDSYEGNDNNETVIINPVCLYNF